MLQTILTVLIPILVAPIGVLVGKLIMAKVHSIQNDNVRIVAEWAIKAAESIFGGNAGAEKFSFVASYLHRKYPWLKEEDVKVLIESICKELFKPADGVDWSNYKQPPISIGEGGAMPDPTKAA